jgi:hypothetical protein
MSWFQLDPQSLAQRAQGTEPPAIGASIVRGAAGFTIVSVAGFVPWAVMGKWLYRHVGEVGMYVACLIVFLGLAGLFLHRLIIGTGSLSRFYKLFSAAFAAYAVAWISGWMSLRGHPGSIVGLLAGTALMGWMLTRAFDAPQQIWKVIAALFGLNAIGYFVGGVFEAHIPGIPGKLMWGVCYGIGFGAGLGLAFHLCQAEARQLLGKP